jgi:hypothetical protein
VEPSREQGEQGRGAVRTARLVMSICGSERLDGLDWGWGVGVERE